MPRFVFTPSSPGGEAELSHNGATFSATGVISSGTHPDGSPWIEVESGAELTSVSPASAEILRDHAAGSLATSPPTLAWTHGLMRDVGAAPSGATLADRQAVNHGTGTTAVPKQGLDQLEVKSWSYKYDHALNIDPGATGNPVTLTPGVYVKAVSKLSGISSQGRPVTQDFGILTVYSQGNAPASGAFRPGLAQGTALPAINTSQVLLSRLANYDVSAYAGSFPTYTEALDILTATRLEAYTYSVNAENILAERAGGGGLSSPAYMGSVAAALGNLMLALNTNIYTSEQKAVLSHQLIQYAIDIAARAREGGVWQENGGHSHIRKEVVAFAARLTDNEYLTEALPYTTTIAVFGGGSASIWGSDRHIFTITQADVDRVKMFPYTADQIGLAEWSSDATRDNPNAAGAIEERQNSLGVATDGVVDTSGGPQNGLVIEKQNYRHIVARGAAPAALALRMMGAVDVRGNPAWFDYYDRHMTARLANGGALPDGANNDTHPFTLYVWEAYRASV
jgi:hypothetical protein